jgi:hypothetical protein
MRLVARLMAVPMLFAIAGCGGGAGYERFIPTEDKARSALEGALTAWQHGAPPGKVDGTNPIVWVADSQRRPGQRLRGYDILGEAPSDARCCYAARLSFENPVQEETVRFVVIGLDPVWVFRHEDYEMTTHWDMEMMKKNKAAAGKQ